MPTPEQIALVKDSFAQILAVREQTATLFYDRLFALNPALRALFQSDMREQRRKLMAMIATAVAELDDPATLRATLGDLGRRHRGYGVSPAEYAAVGSALLWALEQTLGRRYTPDTAAAWTAVYALLADTMKQAA